MQNVVVDRNNKFYKYLNRIIYKFFKKSKIFCKTKSGWFYKKHYKKLTKLLSNFMNEYKLIGLKTTIVDNKLDNTYHHISMVENTDVLLSIFFGYHTIKNKISKVSMKIFKIPKINNKLCIKNII